MTLLLVPLENECFSNLTTILLNIIINTSPLIIYLKYISYKYIRCLNPFRKRNRNCSFLMRAQQRHSSIQEDILTLFEKGTGIVPFYARTTKTQQYPRGYLNPCRKRNMNCSFLCAHNKDTAASKRTS